MSESVDIAALIARLKTKSIWGKFGWEPDEDACQAAAAIESLQACADLLNRSWVAAIERSGKAEARVAELEKVMTQREAYQWGYRAGIEASRAIVDIVRTDMERLLDK